MCGSCGCEFAFEIKVMFEKINVTSHLFKCDDG